MQHDDADMAFAKWAEFNDIYNVEDEELIKRICEYMKKERS